MRRPHPDASWPANWQSSYTYDLLELYGDPSLPGYTYAYENRSQITLQLVDSVASPRATVLDVAAGQGNMSLRLAELGYDVTWDDLRADLSGYVKLQHGRGAVAYQPGDLFDIRPSKPFDLVFPAEVIEQVAHPDEVLKKARTLVAADGHIVVTTPNGEYFRNMLPKFSDCADPAMFESEQFRPDADGHVFLLYPDEFVSLAREAGLRVKSLKLFTNLFTIGYLRTTPLLRRVPARMVWARERATQRLPGLLGRKLNVQIAAVLAPEHGTLPAVGSSG